MTLMDFGIFTRVIVWRSASLLARSSMHLGSSALLVSIFVLITMAGPAGANSISTRCGTDTTIINDGDVADLNTAPNQITSIFTCTRPDYFLSTFILANTDGSAAALTITDLFVTNTTGNAVVPDEGGVSFAHFNFVPVSGLSTVSMDGKFFDDNNGPLTGMSALAELFINGTPPFFPGQGQCTIFSPIQGAAPAGTVTNFDSGTVGCGSGLTVETQVLLFQFELFGIDDTINLENSIEVITLVPEPTTALLFGMGLFGLAWKGRAPG